MRGNERCDEIVRLIDTALDVEVPVARRVAPPAPPSPVPPPTVGHTASRPRQRWVERLRRRTSRPDPLFVVPPAAWTSGPARFATGLHTAGDLAARPVAASAPGPPDAG